MKFFDYLPNVYVGEGINEDESFKYRLVKNIFRRVKVRPDLEKFVNSFETYIISDGETPSSIAGRFFDDPYMDWVLLLANNITDMYDEWPMTIPSLQTLCAEKYDDPDALHHHETQEVLYNDVVFMKKGVEVNSTFRTVLPDGTTKSEVDSVYPVSNYEYEYDLNEKKRMIRVPGPTMVDLITNEFEDLVAYEPHQELDEFNNKKTPMSVAARFLDITGYVAGSVSVTDVTGTIKSYDNGPSSTTTTIY